MESLRASLRHMGVLALFLPIWTAMSQTQSPLKQDLCSSINTGTGPANFSIWQTNGLCMNKCSELGTAFAIVQWQSCWCSDTAPAESTLAKVEEKCMGICPGIGEAERCGSEPDWFGYIALGKPPNATADASGHTRPAETAINDPKPTAVQTVTADGTVRTVFVTPTSNSPGAAALNPQAQSGGPNTGQIVGIVIGVLAAVGVIAGLVLWFLYLRRRRAREDEVMGTPSQHGSSTGALGASRNPEMVVTAGSPDGQTWEPAAGSEQRRSRLMAVDPRMDPFTRGVYMRNKSHESVNTLRDDQDYSRKVHQPVLRAVNPDPNPED